MTPDPSTVAPRITAGIDAAEQTGPSLPTATEHLALMRRCASDRALLARTLDGIPRAQEGVERHRLSVAECGWCGWVEQWPCPDATAYAALLAAATRTLTDLDTTWGADA